MRRLVPLFSVLVAMTPSCSSGDSAAPPAAANSGGGSSGGASSAGMAGQAPTAGSAGQAGGAGAGAAGTGGAAGSGPTICAQLSLPTRAFSSEPGGVHRGDVAADFTVPLADGTTWRFETSFLGCESYVFLPDTLTVSQTDSTSLWAADLPELVEKSPKNAHYFFVSRKSTADAVKASTDAMQKRVDELLAKLEPALATHWRARLHVVSVRAAELTGWVKDALAGVGKGGFAIDRLQRVRGVGNLADVTRFDGALQAAMAWPWKGNLAYALHEVRYFDAQAKQAAELDAEQVTVVDLWKGETLEQFAETDVTLPTAAELAAFDTLRVEITQACPDPNAAEFGNCGAWDYIATLGVAGTDGKISEIARFITSYHRETHWVVDASPMLALLKAGGQRHFRWDFAPEWNKQPTATKLSLRFSNQKKGSAPAEATFLYAGGSFDPTYSEQKKPMTVMIPADAKKVELYTLVTGHGSDKYQCAEFCNHIHRFTVNGNEHLKSFKEANVTDGCVGQTSNGMVPNQGGTWWFGRGGWCPGKQVDPWVVDVTSEVTPGQPAEITYEGLYGSQPPLAKLGDIDLSSYLVVSK